MSRCEQLAPISNFILNILRKQYKLYQATELLPWGEILKGQQNNTHNTFS